MYLNYYYILNYYYYILNYHYYILIFLVEKLGPVVTGFISGFLSTVLVVAFFALLPMVSMLKCVKTV